MWNQNSNSMCSSTVFLISLFATGKCSWSSWQFLSFYNNGQIQQFYILLQNYHEGIDDFVGQNSITYPFYRVKVHTVWGPHSVDRPILFLAVLMELRSTTVAQLSRLGLHFALLSGSNLSFTVQNIMLGLYKQLIVCWTRIHDAVPLIFRHSVGLHVQVLLSGPIWLLLVLRTI